MSKSRRKKRAAQKKKQRGNLLLYSVGFVLVLLVLTGTWLVSKNNPKITNLAEEVTVMEAARLRDSGVFFLDVRQPEEWHQYHIPNSTLIPLDQLEARINEIPKNKAIVVVCRQGNRSLEGRDILLQAGFEPVTSMAGGLQQWYEAGYPLVAGE